MFCHECVERASSVAIGDGKTELRCLADCGNVFSINSLQKVLSTAAFSKWLEKIQLADIERVSLFCRTGLPPASSACPLSSKQRC